MTDELIRGVSGHMLPASLIAELHEKAAAAVATWPELTGEQLAEIRRIFAPLPSGAADRARKEADQ